MSDVVSLGSVNVDHVGYLASDDVASLARRYEWFPAPGETVRVDAVPEGLREALSETNLGGKGANQAVAAARAGADAAFLGAVGVDDSRYGVREGVGARGVDVSGVARVAGPTGSAYVVVDETAENRIAILGGANDAVDEAYVRAHLETLRSASCLLLQNEIPLDGVRWLLDHLGAGPTVILDPAPPGDVRPLVEHERVDVLVPNASEYATLGGAMDTDAVPEFEGTLVRTDGADGVRVSGPDVDSFTVVPPSVDPVDTTGAGDVFTGYLGATLARTGDLETAVRRGVVAAALSTERAGVQSAVPDAETVARHEADAERRSA